MNKEAMKLACKALRDCHYYMIDAGLPNQSLLNQAFTAYTELKAALAEQLAQQNSSWCMKMNDCKTKCEDCPDEVAEQQAPLFKPLIDLHPGLAEEMRAMNTPAQQEPEIVQRVKRYAGQTLRTARNPNITARECIELADWLAAHGITKGGAA